MKSLLIAALAMGVSMPASAQSTSAQSQSTLTWPTSVQTIAVPPASPRPWQMGGNSASGFEPNGHHAYEIIDANRKLIFVIQTEGSWESSFANVQAMIDAVNGTK